MLDAPLRIPQNVETGTLSIWTPTHVRYLQSWLVGEAGERIWKHEFQLDYMGETKQFGVMAEESAPESQIEDMAAWVSERTAAQILEATQRRSGKLAPEQLAEKQNWDVRRELAGAWRDYRKWANKRRASTTGKTLYKGIA